MKRLDIIFGPMFKETVEPRRRQEQRDSNMIKADNTATANLPQNPINMQFNSGFQVERFKNEANEI